MKPKLKIDINKATATPRQQALAIEGLNQADTLAKAGYSSLKTWIQHQERDIEAGRRPDAGPSTAEIEAEAARMEVAALRTEVAGLRRSTGKRGANPYTGSVAGMVAESQKNFDRKCDRLEKLLDRRRQYL